MRRLPLDCAGADLFDKLRDGVILWCAHRAPPVLLLPRRAANSA
jgi:hypothetical protein